jgi:hypothetical protein
MMERANEIPPFDARLVKVVPGDGGAQQQGGAQQGAQPGGAQTQAGTQTQTTRRHHRNQPAPQPTK